MRKSRDARPERARRHVGAGAPSRTGDASSQHKAKLALNRFTYSGGFDGYEGRMILRPDRDAPCGAKSGAASP